MPARDTRNVSEVLAQLVDEVTSPENAQRLGNPICPDTEFLDAFLSNSIVSSLSQAYDVLISAGGADRPRPFEPDALELLKEVTEDLYPMASGSLSRRSSSEFASVAAELLSLLRSENIRGVLESHDAVAFGRFGLNESDEVVPPQAPLAAAKPEPKPLKEGQIEMVSIRRTSDERLGLTVKRENGQLVVARVLNGSVVDKQGLLRPGDIILELNGREVETPANLEALVREAAASGADLVFKVAKGMVMIGPSTTLDSRRTNGHAKGDAVDGGPHSSTYMRAHFSYSPGKDNLLPCQSAGLEFRDGDILEILERTDQNWWQARKVGHPDQIGVIPSQQLEERRKAWVKPEWDMTKSSWLCGLATKRRKRKMMFVVRRNADLEPMDIPIYEEVALLPPFSRKLIVLLGASGVGKRTLKARLVDSKASKYSVALPTTSRPPEPDEVTNPNSPDADFRFASRQEMEADIVQNRYAEWGEYRGHLYGVSLDAIRDVIAVKKTCVIDLNPQALKAVRTSEFLPYVVFLAAPSAEILRNMHEQARLDGLTDREKSDEDFYRTVQESARIERQYRQYFDNVIINDNISAAFDRLLDILEGINTKPQWVPVQWIY